MHNKRIQVGVPRLFWWTQREVTLAGKLVVLTGKQCADLPSMNRRRTSMENRKPRCVINSSMHGLGSLLTLNRKGHISTFASTWTAQRKWRSFYMFWNNRTKQNIWNIPELVHHKKGERSSILYCPFTRHENSHSAPSPRRSFEWRRCSICTHGTSTATRMMLFPCNIAHNTETFDIAEFDLSRRGKPSRSSEPRRSRRLASWASMSFFFFCSSSYWIISRSQVPLII